MDQAFYLSPSKNFKKAGYLFITGVIIIACLVLLGWQFNIPSLKAPIPGMVAMNPLSAVLFIFIGIFYFLHTGNTLSQWRNSGKVLLSVIFLCGVLRIAGETGWVNFYIDTILYHDQLLNSQGSYNDRMTFNAGICFILSAVSLLLITNSKKRKQFYAQLLAVVISFLSLLSIIIFIYKVKNENSLPVYIPMAIHTATCFLLLAGGIFFFRPGIGLMNELTGPYSGSGIARYLLPAAVVVPILFGFFRLKAAWTDLLPFELGTTLLVLSIIIIFTFLIWWSIVSVNKKDKERENAEFALKKIEANYEMLVSSVKDYAIFLIDTQYKIISWNTGAAAITGYSNENIIGKSVNKLYSPEYLQQNFPSEDFNTALMQGNHVTEITLAKKDGSLYTGNIVLTALKDEHNNHYGFSVIIKDVTERKKALELLELMSVQIDESNDAIYITDGKRKIQSWNTGAQKLYGYTKEEMMGKDPDIILKTSINKTNDEVALGDVTARDYSTGEIKRTTKKGNEVLIRSTSTAIRNKEGSIYAYVSSGFDITRQKKLQEQINHLASMVEQSTEAIVSIALDYTILTWNKSAEQLYGFKKKEAIGKKPVDLGLHTLFEKVIAYDEKQITRKDGHSFYGAISANVIKNENKMVSSVCYFVKDISVRKELEKELKRTNEALEEKVKARTEQIIKSEKRFRTIIENVTDGVVLNDRQSKILYQSPSVEKILGYDSNEILGKKILNYVHDDYKNEFKELYDNLASIPAKPFPFQYQLKHKKGHYVWIEGVVTNLLHDLDVNAYVANFRDITLRKESEEAIRKSERIYKTIASSIPGSVICLLDPNYRYLLIEGDILDKLGFSKKILLGQKAEDVLSPQDFSAFAPLFQQTFKGEFITREYSNNGIDTIIRFIPLKDEMDKVYAIMTVTIDVTELKQAQRNIIELNQSLEEKIIIRTEELRKSNEELEAFSYSVSHDLRSPLRAIIGFTSMLEEDYVSHLQDDAKRIMTVIKNNTLKMGSLIDDLLSFSRMSRLDLVKTTVNTRDMINEIIQSPVLYNKAVNINWIIAPLPDIKADLHTIRQVWINLLSNAVKYSGNNSHPCIEIGFKKEKHDIIFWVKDNGVGFDEKYKAKLFRVFQRLHSSEEFEGTGIGLAIVEKIISKHGGKVWAEATLNKGSTFYFSLPILNEGDN